jgi:hypothetical protein
MRVAFVVGSCFQERGMTRLSHNTMIGYRVAVACQSAGLVCSLLLSAALVAQPKGNSSIVRVDADHHSDVHLVLKGRSEIVIRHKPGQVGIAEPKIAHDHRTVGWLLLFPNPDNSPAYRLEDIPAALVIWRDGNVVQRFDTGPTFWDWSFVNDGQQVAFHTGPLHGEAVSHCELRDVNTGRLLSSWEGNLRKQDRPEWTKSLSY